MLKITWRVLTTSASVLALTSLAGCNATSEPPQAEQASPPPQAEQAPPALLGGPPAEDAGDTTITHGEIITDSGDVRLVHPGERREAVLQADQAPPPYYTRPHRVHTVVRTETYTQTTTAAPATSWHRSHHHGWRHAWAHRVAAPLAPVVARPAVRTAPAKAHVGAPVVKPAVQAPPKPVNPPVAVAAPKPVAPPAIVKPVVKPAAAPVLSPIDRLQTAVAANGLAHGAALTVPTDLSAAKPSKVTLALPTTLFGAIRAEAAKLGLSRAARRTDVTATLSGDGYTITPNGTQTAHLKAGQPVTFSWVVQPGPAAKGALKADVNAVLKGAGAAETFSVAKLAQAVASVESAANQAAAGTGFHMPQFNTDVLSIPGQKDIVLPGVGKVQSKSLVVGGILLAIIILLAMMSRASANRKALAERRRRYRTMVTPSAMFADEPVRSAGAAPAPVETAVVPVQKVELEDA